MYIRHNFGWKKFWKNFKNKKKQKTDPKCWEDDSTVQSTKKLQCYMKFVPYIKYSKDPPAKNAKKQKQLLYKKPFMSCLSFSGYQKKSTKPPGSVFIKIIRKVLLKTNSGNSIRNGKLARGNKIASIHHQIKEKPHWRDFQRWNWFNLNNWPLNQFYISLVITVRNPHSLNPT